MGVGGSLMLPTLRENKRTGIAKQNEEEGGNDGEKRIILFWGVQECQDDSLHWNNLELQVHGLK